MTSVELEISAADARGLTDKIKFAVEGTWQLIKEAYESRAWAALGYASWDEYCTREFGTSRLRLPREERQEVVASLRESGLSIRAIASATGDSRETVRRELGATDTNGSVEDPSPVTGVNGKRYQPSQPDPTPVDDRFISADDLDELNTPPPRPAPEPQKPKRKPITDAFFEAIYDLTKLTERISRLSDDDRFGNNSGQIAQKNLSDLTRSRDALERVINQLSQA